MKKSFLAASALISSIFLGSADATAADVKLYTLDCGDIHMKDLAIFAKDGEFNGRDNQAGDACFVIKHPTKGTLLWDTGLPKAIKDLPEGMSVPGFHISLKKSIQDQLAEIGMSEQDIDYVSISHSHFDHVGNLNDFAGSKWIVHENEYAHMFSDAMRAQAQTFSAYDKMENAEKITFTGDHDVFGDGSVTVLSMPGHTPGHTTLLVNLEKEGPVLLTGDLYHLTDSRKLRTVPTFNTNAEDTLKSMDAFEAKAKELGARVVIQHEKKDTGALPKLPGYLD